MRKTAMWLILGISAGVWLGVAGRIAMRFVALEAGTTPGFSSGGSLEVIAFGAIIGTPVALVVWAYRRGRQLPRWSGTAVGMLLLLVVVAFEPPAAKSALAATPDTPLTTALLFVAAFASFGALLDVIWYWRTCK